MKTAKKLVLLTGAFVGVAVLVLVFTSPPQTEADPAITHPNPAVHYNENPAPLYPGNSSESHANFLSQNDAILKAHLSKDAILESTALTTWGKHVHENLRESEVHGQIAADRQVWVVKAKYPNGVDTKGGFYANAVQYIVFDAATGQLLNVMTTGDLKEAHSPVVVNANQ